MKKYLLCACLASVFALGAYAETAVIDFTYAGGELSPYGKGKKETVDVAMCINDPSLAGMKVLGMKAYISTMDGISGTSLWGSKELTVANKQNVPDLFSYDVTPAAATVGEYDLVVLETEFPEPYVLTGDPLYLGYTLTVDDNSTDEQKKPIIISEGNNSNGLFVHMSKSVLKWLDYTETAGGVAYIVATVEGDFPENSLGFKSYNTIYAQENSDFDVLFYVTNVGANTINDLKYSYAVDGGEVKEVSMNLVNPITPSLSLPSILSLTFSGISGYGPHDLTVTITEVNGETNPSSSAQIECVANVIPFVPVHRPLVEEFTGTWCGWCPRGFLAMEMIAEDYGDSQVSICYHNGDPMEVTAVYPGNVSGFPSASIDRNGIIDPYYGTYTDKEFGIASDLEKAMDEIAVASIEVESSLDGDIVNVESQVKFIQDINEANYQIGYVLVCNGLSGSESSWVQSNYYAGEKGYEGTPLEILTTWEAKQPGLVFNDVAVDVSGMNGVSGSLPSSVVTAQEYNHDYSFDISGNTLVQDPANLVITAFIVDKSNGKIVNANKCAIGTSGVKSLDAEKEVVATEFFDLTGRKVVNPSHGLYVKVEKLSDGTHKASKILLTK